MALLNGKWQPLLAGDTVRHNAAYASHKFRLTDLESELCQVERQIAEVTNKTRTLANELGIRYAVFRCIGVRYDNGRDIHNSDIMMLSRETDKCIDTVYQLEQRRKELLNKIGK